MAGIFPPITTPFETTGSQNVAYDYLKQNVAQWNKAPFKGYVVLGSNGESVSLTMDEKLKVLKTVREAAKQEHILIAGAGCQSTKETIDFCKKIADDKSADAVLIITPSFFKASMTVRQ